jgi:hypothetical protein
MSFCVVMRSDTFEICPDSLLAIRFLNVNG